MASARQLKVSLLKVILLPYEQRVLSLMLLGNLYHLDRNPLIEIMHKLRVLQFLILSLPASSH